MKTEAGVGVMQPQGQDRLELLEAEEARVPPPLKTTADTLISDF